MNFPQSPNTFLKTYSHLSQPYSLYINQLNDAINSNQNIYLQLSSALLTYKIQLHTELHVYIWILTVWSAIAMCRYWLQICPEPGSTRHQRVYTLYTGLGLDSDESTFYYSLHRVFGARYEYYRNSDLLI